MGATSPRLVSQHHSTELSGQERLPLKHPAALELPLTAAVARARECRSLGAAMEACATAAGLDFDKQVSSSLGLDKAQLSRWHNNTEGVRETKFVELQQLCGNWIPLLYLVGRAGFDPASLRVYESRLERENRELREQLAAARRLLIGQPAA